MKFAAFSTESRKPAVRSSVKVERVHDRGSSSCESAGRLPAASSRWPRRLAAAQVRVQ